ncbi:MAG: ABC transporter ATP-binding protein [Brevinematales bacterium]|nr:ABC transporter ATP-binding protein [Brevinematales bacterium]
MTEIIKAININKIYKTIVDEVCVFENINLSINRGEAVAIVGESGRGKTTLLNILSGLDKPTQGEVIFNNIRIDNLSEEEISDFRNNNIGFIFQHHYLLNDFNALENVLIPFKIRENRTDKNILNYAKELLERVGLKDRIYHYPDQLSGGERQRVAVARAIVHKPLVIFADEPTGSLDRKNAEKVENILWELKKDFNITLIIATHSKEIASMCDRKIEM